MEEQNKTRRWLAVTASEECQGAFWRPLADVYRTRRGWLVKFDLAGVRPDEIEVELAGSRLKVRGLRRDWQLEEGQRYYSLEIAYHRFERCVDLEGDLGEARVTTDYRDGMLLVHLITEAGS